MKNFKPGCLYLLLLACLTLSTFVNCDDSAAASVNIPADVSSGRDTVGGLKDNALEKTRNKHVISKNPDNIPVPIEDKVSGEKSGLDEVEVAQLVALSDNTNNAVTKDKIKLDHHIRPVRLLPAVGKNPVAKMHLLPLKRTDRHNSTVQHTQNLGKITVPVLPHTHDKISVLARKKEHAKQFPSSLHPAFLEKPKLHQRRRDSSHVS